MITGLDIIVLLLIMLAGVFKSIADTLDHHFDTSVFRNKDRGFWDPNVIHKTCKTVFNYPIDAWHISNSLMIFCFSVAVVINDCQLLWFWQIKIAVMAFVIPFNVFYNKVWR